MPEPEVNININILDDCHYCGAENVPVKQYEKLAIYVGIEPSPGALCEVCQHMRIPTTLERHNRDLARCTRLVLECIRANKPLPPGDPYA